MTVDNQLARAGTSIDNAAVSPIVRTRLVPLVGAGERTVAEHFNYIAYGAEEYLAVNVLEYEMSRSRMFEYTPVDLEKRLENLRSGAVEFIDRLPTFLCSEIHKGEVTSMIVRFGSISGTTVTEKHVTTTFNPIVEFGEVTFDSIDDAKKLFGADGFQLYRTHWAVKTGDVGPILMALAHRRPDKQAEVLAHLQPAAPVVADAQPPDRDKNVIGEADSVEALLKLLYGRSEPDRESFFRGHEDETFELTPSLMRKWPTSGNWKYLPVEDRLCNELLIAHYDEFQSDQFCFDRLVRMQHYGLPTRLLDISGNPLVALYFACAGKEEMLDKPGEVIAFGVAQDTIKYYDSDTVSVLANLSKLTRQQKDEIDLAAVDPPFNATTPIRKLHHHIKSEKGYFEPRIDPSHLGSVLCVKAKRTNNRIKSQTGAFLLFGHEAKLPEGGTEAIRIFRITVTNKRGILKQLDSININATTVYPSIDQTAVHLRDRYELPAS